MGCDAYVPYLQHTLGYPCSVCVCLFYLVRYLVMMRYDIGFTPRYHRCATHPYRHRCFQFWRRSRSRQPCLSTNQRASWECQRVMANRILIFCSSYVVAILLEIDTNSCTCHAEIRIKVRCFCLRLLHEQWSSFLHTLLTNYDKRENDDFQKAAQGTVNRRIGFFCSCHLDPLHLQCG